MRGKALQLALVVVLMLAIPATGCRKKAEAGDLGLKQSATSISNRENAPGTDASEAPKASSDEASQGKPEQGDDSSSANTSGGSSSGGTGSGGSSGSSSGQPSGGSSNGGSSNASIMLKVLWWNDTQAKSPEGCEIVFGASSFKPSSDRAAASGPIGPVPFDKRVQLAIYPDGRDGKRILVPLTVDDSMIANSERDAVHVEISDARVRVLGNAVDGFDLSFDRF